MSLAACCVAAALLAGCARERSSGTALEAARLARGESITVVWFVGNPLDPYVHEAMVKDGTYGQEYERCTSLLIARSFSSNGYRVLVRRIATGEKLAESLPRDVRYALVIQSRSARVNKLRAPGSGRAGPADGFGAVILEMQVDLVDRVSNKRLWTGSEAFFTDARNNAPGVLRIVKALAADGYLDIKPDNVLDAAGKRVEPGADPPAVCPT